MFSRKIKLTPANDQQHIPLNGEAVTYILQGEHGVVEYFNGHLSYHSPVPIYHGQMPLTSCCPHLDGRPCYSYPSEIEITLGVWDMLEDYYLRVFGGDD